MDAPTVGQWADHKYQELDPRQVVEVSEDGESVRLEIMPGYVTDWVPADNYEFTDN